MDSNSFIILIAVASSAMAVPVSGTGLATSSNSTISCNWSSPAEVVGDVRTYQLNVTDIVAQCANICELTFGSSNLDISGITGKGVLISSLCQAVLACLFGPLLPVLIWLTTFYSWQAFTQRIPLLRKLQRSVYEINGFFSISLLVAAIVRSQQSRSIMEIVFISSLLDAQLMLLMAMLWGQFGHSSMHHGDLGWAWSLYYFTLGGAQMVTNYAVGLPEHTFAVYNHLARECHAQHQFADLSHFLMDPVSGKTALAWCGITFGAGLVGGFLVSILCTTPRRWVDKSIHAFIPPWLRTHGGNLGTAITLLLYICGVIIETRRMNTIHKLLKKVLVNPSQENDWGYGQTTALLFWVLFTWIAIKETISHRREPPPRDDEVRMVSPETALSPEAGAVPPPYSPESGLASRTAPNEMISDPRTQYRDRPGEEGDDFPLPGMKRRNTEPRLTEIQWTFAGPRT